MLATLVGQRSQATSGKRTPKLWMSQIASFETEGLTTRKYGGLSAGLDGTIRGQWDGETGFPGLASSLGISFCSRFCTSSFEDPGSELSGKPKIVGAGLEPPYSMGDDLVPISVH